MIKAITRVWHFYAEGFRGMTWGRTLWFLILLKLFIMFFVLKLFFFPNFLSSEVGDGDKGGYVSRELIDRSIVSP